MFRRLTGRLGKRPPDVPQAQDARKAGGHGDHWGCIYRADQQVDVIALIRKSVESDSAPDRSVPGVEAYCLSNGTDTGSVGTCVLVARGRVMSAYPDVSGGPVWPITLSEVIPWANGVEGQLRGTCMDAEVCFFDTRFYRNQGKYKVGETYNFRMGALTYQLGVAEEMEAERGADEGKIKVSLKGACAYMPASLGNSSADIDDYWFHSPLDDPPAQAEFDGKKLQVYNVTLAVPYDFEMSIPLYAAQHALAPEMASVTPGDDVKGFLWLQGYVDEE